MLDAIYIQLFKTFYLDRKCTNKQKVNSNMHLKLSE